MAWLETGIEAQSQYYQPQQFPYQAAPAFNPGALQPQFTPEPAPQPAASVYGFPAYEAEIVYYMTAVWGNLSGFDIPAYIQRRPEFGRPPSQLTVEECYALMNEFAAYAQQKQGGQ
jgi:hypothetical protein